MQKKNTMSVTDTAKIIEKPAQYVRLGLQQERLPFRKCSTKREW